MRAAVAIVLIAALLGAQVPAQGVIAFTGARVIDGTGSAPIEQATIVITNGRITAIGPSATRHAAGRRHDCECRG
mgnify:CR=1 FL=1